MVFFCTAFDNFSATSMSDNNNISADYFSS